MTRREFILYVDESIHSKQLIADLVAAGVSVRQAGVDVPRGADDQTWLGVIGTNGWIGLTRDQRIRYRKLEKDALKASGVGVFTFTGGQATAAETSAAVCAQLEKMRSIAASQPKPFLYTFGLSGPLAKVTL